MNSVIFLLHHRTSFFWLPVFGGCDGCRFTEHDPILAMTQVHSKPCVSSTLLGLLIAFDSETRASIFRVHYQHSLNLPWQIHALWLTTLAVKLNNYHHAADIKIFFRLFKWLAYLSLQHPLLKHWLLFQEDQILFQRDRSPSKPSKLQGMLLATYVTASIRSSAEGLSFASTRSLWVS